MPKYRVLQIDTIYTEFEVTAKNKQIAEQLILFGEKDKHYEVIIEKLADRKFKFEEIKE